MVAVFVLDKRLRCDFINAVAEILTGLSFSQAKGRSFETTLWPGRSDEFEKSTIGQVLASGTGGEGEDMIADGSGVPRPFSFRISPLGVPGDPGGTVVELVDLSGIIGIGRALRESEQRLRLAVEATGIGIWDVNALTGERRWSPEFTAILGLPDDTPPDADIFSARIHPADRDRVSALYDEAYSHGSSGIYHAEFRIYRADTNVERWVSTTGRITFDKAGRPLRGVGTLRDIDERRRYEDILREREERLRVALVAGRMGTWRYDLRTGEQQWDETQYHLFGLDPSVKPSRGLFLSLVHPDDLAKVTFDDPIPIGTYLDSEFRVRRRDNGDIRWISAHSIARADATGSPIEMIGVNRDVTEQKKSETSLRISEERHRLAMEANAVGTWDYDVATGEHRWSDQFKTLWGLPLDAPCDPALLRPLVDEQYWETTRQRWAEARDPDTGGRLSAEYPVRRTDGSKRWFSFAGQIFFDEIRRTPVRAIGIMLDVTDRREAEERQRMILKELNHRVKNSLAVVQAIVSQTLRMSKPSEAFERIQARLMAIARTHDFLNLSNWGGVSLAELLRSELDPYAAVNEQRVVLEGTPIDLDSKSALTLGLTFHELATNAAKYGSLSSPNGRLEVRWSIVDGAEGTNLTIAWVESGGPPVRAPRRSGFGSRLINGSLRGNLNGSVTLDYARDGLQCQIVFPLTAEIGTPDFSAAGASRGQAR